ncbi:ABC transporter permease subunit [Anaeromicropila herbilytica]|uniref:ABC transporter permease n=1 Tax=Anaeromicropila herbilytica TaxID=2785025 RepID=A0A7R7EK17_9FIRM|nr:ABC transporter permease subunit [Anaeromicropila herbilytica]BCN30189.1 ABC transporter permease [Anaeromicropila herbilytica]
MILKHELKLNIKTFLIWTIIIAGMDFGFMLMYPSLQDALNNAMDAYASMGAITQAFGMDRLSMAEPIGFYGAEIGSIFTLGGALFAAIIGSGILSKEEAGHTSEFLFTLPFSRVNVVLQKVAAVILLILAFDIINLLFGVLSFVIIDADLQIKKLFFFHLAQFFMHVEVATICILFSAFMKKVNLGLGLGVALLLYFLDIMSRILDQLKFAKYVTPFYYANAADVLTESGIDMKLLGIGFIVMIISITVGAWYYNHRDLAA